jgi:hypothetical protein
MASEQVRWNEKYSRRGLSLSPPVDFLVNRKHLLRPGTVLDMTNAGLRYKTTGAGTISATYGFGNSITP